MYIQWKACPWGGPPAGLGTQITWFAAGVGRRDVEPRSLSTNGIDTLAHKHARAHTHTHTHTHSPLPTPHPTLHTAHQVAQLRGEVESAQNALLQAKEQYKADLQNLQSKLEQDADTTKHEAKERHRREVVELEHALQEAEEAHKKQVVALRQQLQTAHERELAALQDDHRKEREALREQLEGAAEVKTRQVWGAGPRLVAGTTPEPGGGGCFASRL